MCWISPGLPLSPQPTLTSSEAAEQHPDPRNPTACLTEPFSLYGIHSPPRVGKKCVPDELYPCIFVFLLSHFYFPCLQRMFVFCNAGKSTLNLVLGNILIFATVSFLLTESQTRELNIRNHKGSRKASVVQEKSQRDQGSCFLRDNSGDLRAHNWAG